MDIGYEQCLRHKYAIEEYKSYSEYVNKIKDKLNYSNSGMGLFSPSSYIIKFDDTVIAVDPCLFLYNVDKDGEKSVLDLINLCDAVIVTHKHRDHYDPELIDKISSEISVYCADFIEHKKDSVINVRAGDKVRIKSIDIDFFESFHTLGCNVVPEVGFCITFNGDKYVFPIDVRDYDKEYPDFGAVKILVAHLWLGKQNALNVSDNPYAEKFSDFVNRFNAKKIYVSHLYGVHRKVDDMWTDIHYNLIKDKITESSMIKFGDWIDF